MLYLSIFLISACICFFGFVTLIKDNTIMVTVAMILRASQGFTRALTLIPCRSLLAIIEPRDKIRYMGLLEAASAVGEGMGPIIGSFLYKLVGFVFMFVILGCFHFIYIPLMMYFMPNNIDSDQEATTLIKSNTAVSEDSKISFFKLITNRLIIQCSISNFLAHIAYCYVEPVLSFRIAEFTDSVYVTGFMCSILIAGMMSMALVIPFLSKIIDPINLISLGLLL